MSKIIRIEEGIETYDERNKFFEDASIYLPSTLKNIGSLCFASYEEEVKFEVVYNGTKEDFLKIKKGRMVFTEVKDDFYGEYYHNTPSSSTTKKRYFNWISFCNPVLINCLDGSFLDDEEENSKNYYKSYHESFYS